MARSVFTTTTATDRAWPARTAIGAHWLALRIDPATATSTSAPLADAAEAHAHAPVANAARLTAG